MSIKKLAFGGVAATLAFSAVMAVAYDGNPPTAHTGAPAVAGVTAERLCTRCHGGNAVNTGGSVQLLDAPAAYVAGQTYTMRLRVTSSQTASASSRVWGFELTGVRASDGSGVGTFANVTGQGTSVNAGTGSFASRSYVVVGTNNQGGSASPIEWQVKWTAPASPAGDVTFYFMGIAANGDGSESGDWVYTNSLVSQDATTPVHATTWGDLKSRYRF